MEGLTPDGADGMLRGRSFHPEVVMVTCGKCTPLANCAMGAASECGHECSSQGYRWCARCALQKRVCQLCGKPIPPPKKGGKKKRRVRR